MEGMKKCRYIYQKGFFSDYNKISVSIHTYDINKEYYYTMLGTDIYYIYSNNNGMKYYHDSFDSVYFNILFIDINKERLLKLQRLRRLGL